MERETRSLTRIEIGIVVVLLACVFSIYAVWSRGRYPFDRYARHRQLQCRANLKQIGFGFIEYAEEHGNRFPERDGIAFLAVLYEKMQDPLPYLCPADEETKPADGPTLLPGNTSYCGRKNGAAANRLTSERIRRNGTKEPLVADKSSRYHDGERGVAFADGHVEILSEEDFEAFRDALDPSD